MQIACEVLRNTEFAYKSVRRETIEHIAVPSMSDFNPDVEFLGLRVPAGKPLAVPNFVAEDDQTGITHRPHITGVALGPKPKPGRHTVFAHGNGMEAVVGTLEMGRCEQFQVDLVARDITFSHNGTSDIYLSGYNTTSAAYFDDMSEEEDDEESEEDEDVPKGVPIQRNKPLPSQMAKAVQQALIDEAADDDEEDDSEDDEEDDDEEEDGDEEEEDSDEAARRQAGIAHLKRALTSEPLNGKEFSDMDDDDDDMEDDDEEEEDDEDQEEADGVSGLSDEEDEDEDDSSEDEEEEAQQGPAAVLLAAGGKRAKPPAVTPQPAKKAKVASAVTRATAPASKPQPTTAAAQPGLTGPLAAQWLSALKTHLTQSGGKTDLSKLGSVKKPEGIAKGQRLKAFLLQHTKTFAVDGNTVKLKK